MKEQIEAHKKRQTEWLLKNSLENNPLTDELRKHFQEQFKDGFLRMRIEKDGTVKFFKAHRRDTRFPFFAPIDLENGLLLADGEFQVTDSPLLPAYKQWLEELVAECKQVETS